MNNAQPPEFEKLLEIYRHLAGVADPVRLAFEIDHGYQVARKQCGMKSLAAFKGGFAAYQEQRDRGGMAT